MGEGGKGRDCVRVGAGIGDEGVGGGGGRRRDITTLVHL